MNVIPDMSVTDLIIQLSQSARPEGVKKVRIVARDKDGQEMILRPLRIFEPVGSEPGHPLENTVLIEAVAV